MEPVFAQRLDNFYAEDGQLVLRNGSASHVTGITGGVVTLMLYDGGGTPAVFAAGNDAIYNVTSAGAVGSAVQSSLTDDRWDWTMFSDLSNALLVCANGADAVRTWNGAAWATPSITGATSANLKGVLAHKNRLWAIQDGTLDAWYNGTVNAVAGAYTKFPLGPLCQRGGQLAALATWTRDGGSGADDYWVAITTAGEVLVYGGTDPSSDFAMVGRYEIAPPLGSTRCVTRMGSALLILTRAGVVSMDDVLMGTTEANQISGAIEPTFLSASATDTTSALWRIYWHRRENRIIVNVPDYEETVVQFVYSASSGSWSRLIGLAATDWLETGNKLYFGSAAGTVFEAEVGTDDAGAAIKAEAIFAPSKMGSPSIKHFRRARVHFFSQGNFDPSISVVTDYETPEGRIDVPAETVSAGAVWDTALWNDAQWYRSAYPRRKTRSISGRGIVGALRIGVHIKGTAFRVIGAEVSAEAGRVL
jgi:hypothetical protein